MCLLQTTIPVKEFPTSETTRNKQRLKVCPIFLTVLGRKEQLDPFTVAFMSDDFSHNFVKVAKFSYIN